MRLIKGINRTQIKFIHKQQKMEENMKKEYDTPMVEVLRARVEKGFQVSNIDPTGSNEDLISSGEVHGGSDFD